MKGMTNIFRNRRFKYGSFATLLTIGFVVAIIIINVISSLLVDRFPLSIDLTKDKVFEVSDQTKEFLNTLTGDVEVVVLAQKEDYLSAGGYYAQAITVLDTYGKLSGKVKVSYVNLVNDPTLVSKYPDLQLTTGDILIRSDKRTKKITTSDLFNTEYDQSGNQSITSSKAEEALTSALVGVTSSESVLVTLISGHDETVSTGLSSILSTNNYDSATVKLLNEDIKAESKFAVINAPLRDFSADELKKLDTFLSNGGKLGKTLLYFASSEQPALPNLEAFLKEWGIAVGAGVVYETDNSMLGANSPFATFTEFSSTDYAGTLQARDLLVAMPNGRPINQAFTTQGNISTVKLLGYSAKSYVTISGTSDTATDQKGPFGAAVRSQKTIYVDTNPLSSNVIAFATSSAIEEGITTNTGLGNGEYVAKLFNDISEKKSTISIVPKSVGTAQMQLNQAQAVLIIVIFVVLLPLAILVCGIVIWIKRRNR